MVRLMPRILPVLLWATLGLPGLGSEWKPIPPEVWSIREDAAKGYRDAVVLEKRTIFANNLIETIFRVRVFSEAGMRAAELARFSRDCHHISGRTVYPDGRVIEYDRIQDFAPVAAGGGPEEESEPRVLPKGVTADCIVEVRWQESTWKKYSSPLPRRLGSFAEWELGGPYATLSETLELVEAFKWRTNLLPGRFGRPELAQADGYRIIRYRNLPAIEAPPFSLPPLLERPRFQVFDLPKVLYDRAVKGIDEFWKGAMIVPIPKLITRDRIGTGSDRTMNTSRVFKDLGPSVKDSFVDFVRKGSAYTTMAKELLAGLPEPPQARARELLRRLATKVTNSREVLFEEEEREDMEEQDRIRTGPENIEEVVKARRTDSKGMQILCFQLLKDAGLRPKLALLANRQVRLFNYNAPIAWQFTDRLLGIEEPGQSTLWLDPARTLLPPGVIHPDLQGTDGLIVDTDSWVCQPFRMPLQTAATNQRRFDYQLSLEEDRVSFRLETAFLGFPRYEEGLRYLKLDPRDQGRELQGRLQQAEPGLTVTRADVKPPASTGGPLSWVAEGRLAAAGTSGSIRPFPGMPSALPVPEALPAQRTTPLAPPCGSLQAATSTFLIPPGSTVAELPAFRRSNRFGSVDWTLSTRRAGEQVRVTVACEVRVNAEVAPAQAYDEFRTFLGWIGEAEGKIVPLARP